MPAPHHPLPAPTHTSSSRSGTWKLSGSITLTLPGLMLVEGIIEQLPIEPHPGSVTVRGRLLAESEDLAASAVPIQSVFVAPDEG
jgi:hypothetical protein